MEPMATPTTTTMTTTTAGVRVMLLDLDGTLIGKVNYAVCEYDLMKATEKKAGRAAKAFRDTLVARLRYGIVRPHVEAFCKHAQQASEGTELFVYTASDAEWAAFIVPCVEAALGIKFNRPIFARNHCINVAAPGSSPDYRKSIAKVAPAILTRLRKKHPTLRTVRDLTDRILLVDNTPNIMMDPSERGRLVVCPTYSYAYAYDVLGRLDVNVMHRKFARVIMPTLVRFGLFPQKSHPQSYQQFAAVYYERLARTLADSQASNLAALAHDRFWAHLTHALPPATRFTDEVVRALNRHTNRATIISPGSSGSKAAK
jgi:hypothetical protein